MNILQLSHRLPWPPVDGGKKGTLGFVEGYRKHADVSSHSLLCMCPTEEVGWAREWQSGNMDLAFDPMDARNNVLDFLLNTLFSSKPYNIAKYKRASFEALIEAAVRQCVPDVVHFDSLHTAWYTDLVGDLAPRALKVLRCHNAEHIILKRLAESQINPFKKSLIGLQAKRLLRYEAAELDSFDLILAITEEDAQRFRDINPGIDDKMMVIPAGAVLPPQLPASPSAGDKPLRLLHIAAMDWIPNQEALRWLLTKVLPILNSLNVNFHLDVIGKNMPAEFLNWQQDNVSVHGFVQDLQPYLSRAHLALVPLQVGGGMRVKILDYWSMGIPVVATRIGAEGLSDFEVPVVALGDTPQEFATEIVRLSASLADREALRTAAFRNVSEHYGWPSLIGKLVAHYQSMLQT